MLTGFNTDISYSGTTYHVQTEDKGEANPMIESLVYVRGAILAAKRTYYLKELQNGISEEQLQSMLEKQHRTILAVIKAGRIQELVEKLNKQRPAQEEGEIAATPVQAPTPPPMPQVKSPVAEPVAEAQPAPVATVRNSGSFESGVRPDMQPLFAEFDLDKIIFEYLQTDHKEEKIEICLLGETEFYAGDSVILQVEVKRNGQPITGVPVVVKVIGTTFKPQVYTGRTGAYGVSAIPVSLPLFNAGSAAIVVQTSSEAGEAEVKHLIRRR